MKSFKGIPISRMMKENYLEKISWRHLKSDQLVNGLKGSVGLTGIWNGQKIPNAFFIYDLDLTDRQK